MSIERTKKIFVFALVMTLLASGSDAKAKLVENEKLHGNMINWAKDEITDREFRGCISHEEAVKLGDDLQKIITADWIYRQHMAEKTGDKMKMYNDPANLAKAQKIVEYLQTKNAVNEKYKFKAEADRIVPRFPSLRMDSPDCSELISDPDKPAVIRGSLLRPHK